MEKVAFIKIEITIQCPFNDLASLSGNPIVFNPNENEVFEVIRTKSETEDSKLNVSFSVKGTFRFNIDARLHESLSKKEADSVIIRNDPDHLISLFLKNNLDNCIGETRRILENIRWMFNLSGGNHREQLMGSLSIDKINWNLISLSKIAGIRGFVTKWENVTDLYFEKAVDQLIRNKGIQEPIYHKMIREAQDIVFTNPKSAYMIAVSALEVAIKSYIQKKKPDTSWLLENIPSPDIHKILKHYFPELDPKFKLPDIFLDKIRVIITNRNELIHKGQFSIELQSVVERIDLANDIIHLIDGFLGYKWGVYNQSMNRLDANSKPAIRDIKTY